MPPSTKTSTQIWVDFFKDLVGIDKGYLFTLKAVYSNPDDVFKSYFDNKGKYLSPFALLGISFGIYYLISGLLVDWTIVSDALKGMYLRFIEWEIQLLSEQPEKNAQVVANIRDSFISPMVNIMISSVSKYLLAIVIPTQVIFFYCAAIFTRKHGYGFYHHFISFNYFMSFALLFVDIIILVGLINPWLMLPCVPLYFYFIYGLWFKSYGVDMSVVRKAIGKGFTLGFVLIIAIGVLVGVLWGWFIWR